MILEGGGLQLPKIGGGKRGRRALKNGGSSLAVGSYLQRGSAPPPPRALQSAPSWVVTRRRGEASALIGRGMAPTPSWPGGCGHRRVSLSDVWRMCGEVVYSLSEVLFVSIYCKRRQFRAVYIFL